MKTGLNNEESAVQNAPQTSPNIAGSKGHSAPSIGLNNEEFSGNSCLKTRPKIDKFRGQDTLETMQYITKFGNNCHRIVDKKTSKRKSSTK
jgi:hypothetical protein